VLLKESSKSFLTASPPVPVELTDSLGDPEYIMPASKLKLQALLLMNELS